MNPSCCAFARWGPLPPGPSPSTRILRSQQRATSELIRTLHVCKGVETVFLRRGCILWNLPNWTAMPSELGITTPLLVHRGRRALSSRSISRRHDAEFIASYRPRNSERSCHSPRNICPFNPRNPYDFRPTTQSRSNLHNSSSIITRSFLLKSFRVKRT